MTEDSKRYLSPEVLGSLSATQDIMEAVLGAIAATNPGAARSILRAATEMEVSPEPSPNFELEATEKTRWRNGYRSQLEHFIKITERLSGQHTP